MVSYDKEEGRILSTRTWSSRLLVSRRVEMEQSLVCVKTKLGTHGRLTRAGRDLCLNLKNPSLQSSRETWWGMGWHKGQTRAETTSGRFPQLSLSAFAPASSEVTPKSHHLTPLLIPSDGLRCILSKHVIAQNGTQGPM